MRFGAPVASVMRRAAPNLWDAVAFVVILGVLIGIVYRGRGMNAPMPAADVEPITLSYASLPY